MGWSSLLSLHGYGTRHRFRGARTFCLLHRRSTGTKSSRSPIQGNTVPAAVSMFATTLDLAHVNISAALRAEMKKRDRYSELKPGIIWYRRDTLAYWAQTVMIGLVEKFYT